MGSAGRCIGLRTMLASLLVSSLLRASASFVHPQVPSLFPSHDSISSRGFSSSTGLRRQSTDGQSGQPGCAPEEGHEKEGKSKNVVTVRFKGQTFEGEQGELLRTIMLQNKVTPHNQGAQLINCRGLGTCGTCAVQVDGQVEPTSWNGMEKTRLNFPPHSAPNNQRLRLACQVRAMGDLQVSKFGGFWGQNAEESEDQSFSAPLGEVEFVVDRTKRALRDAIDGAGS